MSTLNQQAILLTGLPGAGKSRVAQSLSQQFECKLETLDSAALEKTVQPGCMEWQSTERFPERRAGQQQWCVIDIRSPIPDQGVWIEELLAQFVARADGIVLTFAEETELNQQAWWNHWLTQVSQRMGMPSLPVVRWFYQQFPPEFSGFDDRNTEVQQTDFPCPVANLRRYRYHVGRIMLDHLLMGLDNSMRALGMRITRVKATVETFEYDNLIVIEGTPYSLKTFAADEPLKMASNLPVSQVQILPVKQQLELGMIEIEGMGLQKDWLDQLVQASRL